MKNLLRRWYATTVFYPTLAWNVMLGRILKLRNWWDPIDPYVVLGARPFAADVPVLRQLGIRAVVNTCEEYVGPVAEYQQHQIVQLHIPTTDFVHPSLEDVDQAVEFIQQHVADGNKVYIHCKAGRARSATVAICWLMKYRSMTAQQAQQKLLECRPHTNAKLTRRPVVQQFAANLSR